jgi:hypothetical protein
MHTWHRRNRTRNICSVQLLACQRSTQLTALTSSPGRRDHASRLHLAKSNGTSGRRLLAARLHTLALGSGPWRRISRPSITCARDTVHLTLLPRETSWRP